jgi:hypothetical protein
LLAGALLTGVSQVQRSLNREREELGLTRVTPLENAPPVLAFTTVALGGFRGLISNALWIRASELQDEDKFFEMAQLADWITKLEPHFAQVWVHQAWNMSYNISVKFKDASDRWRWVQRGIKLLRDEGLRYNPNEPLLYRELGWHFQHKMGHNLDDANMYYKQRWAEEMTAVLGGGRPNFGELMNPQTPEAQERVRLLREEYKMEPADMREVDERYGPLEWRLPETHAIYWATLGLKKAGENPDKVNKEDLIQLRRVIYQSMQMAFQRGRLVENPFAGTIEFGPNLEIIPKTNAAYEQAMEEDEKNRDHISRAHRNFVRDAVYFLYGHNRMLDAANWYKYLGARYPDRTLLDGQTNSFPRNVTLDQYAVGRLEEDIGEAMGRDRVKAAVEGLLMNSFSSLAIDEDDRAAGFVLLARRLFDQYHENIKTSEERIGLTSFEEIQREVRNRFLAPESGVPAEMRAIIRTKLGLPAETAPDPAINGAATTNAPAKAASR